MPRTVVGVGTIVPSVFVRLCLALAVIVSGLPLSAPALAATVTAAAPAAATTASCTTFLESSLFGFPQEMVYGPLGRLWVTEIAGTRGVIEGIDPAGTSAIRIILPDSDPFLGGGIVTPTGISVGPDGALWFVGWGTGYDRVGRVDPAAPAPAPVFHDLPVGSHPSRIVTFAGALWITAPGADTLLEVSTAGVVTAHPLPAGSAPADLAIQGGALWVTERGLGRIARVDGGGAVTAEYATGGDPTLIRSDGTALWYTKKAASRVGRLDPLTALVQELATPTVGAAPAGLALDGVGGVWVTESAANRMARVDAATFPAATSIDETVLTVSSQQPLAVSALPDGTVWFGQYAPLLAHFKPAASGAILPLPPALALSVSGASATTAGGVVYATTTTFTIAASTSGICVDRIFYRVYPAGGVPGSFTAVAAPSVSFTLPNGPGWVVEFCAEGPGGVSLTTTSAPFTVDDSAFPDLVPPVLSVPAPITVAATGPAGATVVFTASATDNLDPAPAVTCDHSSGSVFLPGTTTVRCTAADAAGNVSAPASFTVTVTVPPPVLHAPASVTAPATGLVTEVAIPLTASSVVDGAVFLATCGGATVASASAYTPGSVLLQVPTGSHTVTCRIADAHGNTAAAVVAVRVTTVAPTVSVPADRTALATSPAGAVVTYTASATSVGYGPLAVACDRPSGATFPIGTTRVSCAATDPEGQRGTASFAVTVVVPAPVLTLPADITRSTYRPSVAVTYTASAASTVYGPLAVTCAPPSGSLFAAGATTTVTCAASDPLGQTTSGSFTVTVAKIPCGPAIVALSPRAEHALTIEGDARVRVVCGDVVVVSTARGALRVGGRGTLDATSVTVGRPFDDPWAAVAAPDMTGYPTFGAVRVTAGTVVLRPGSYAGISVGGRASVTFLPGPYVLRGGLRITGGSVRGDGVVFYNAVGRASGDEQGRERGDEGEDRDGAHDPRCGELRITGGSVSLRAGADGALAGMLFVQDRACAATVRIAGRAALTSLDGVLYAPAARVELTGGAELRLGLRIVGDTVRIGGRGAILFDPGP